MSDPFSMSRALEKDLPGYDRAIATLVIDHETRAALRAAVIAGHEYDNPGRQLPKVVGPVLAGKDWRWPLFDEWQTRFAVAGEYPRNWDDLVDEDAGSDGHRKAVLDLFCHYLQMCAYADAQWRRIGEAAKNRPFLRLSLVTGEPASVAALEMATWEAADLAANFCPTPLFPGSRATLMQLSARDMERHEYRVGGQVRELPSAPIAAPAAAPVRAPEPTPEPPKESFFNRLFGR